MRNAGLAQNQSQGLEKDQERPGSGRLGDQGKILPLTFQKNCT